MNRNPDTGVISPRQVIFRNPGTGRPALNGAHSVAVNHLCNRQRGKSRPARLRYGRARHADHHRVQPHPRRRHLQQQPALCGAAVNQNPTPTIHYLNPQGAAAGGRPSR
ncbi:MAG: hypothetical protein IPF56_12015 [Chloroflexi bacterium]|nr:hypothetical protein [Chloroflexota bacterium]